MNLETALRDIRQHSHFTKNIGMVTTHRALVQAWSQREQAMVSQVRVTVNPARVQMILNELEKRPGIVKIFIQVAEGELRPGEEMLGLVVAGDVAENVNPVVQELVERMDSQAMSIQEYIPHSLPAPGWKDETRDASL